MKRSMYIRIHTLFIILGILFTIYYFGIYQENTSHIVYFVLSEVSAAEAAFAATSVFFYVRAIHNRITVIFHILAGVFGIPILLLTMVWFLYFIGFEIIPPPQR